MNCSVLCNLSVLIASRYLSILAGLRLRDPGLRALMMHMFPTVPAGLSALPQHYDSRLIVLSVVIAIFASYAALDLAGRTAAS